MNEEKLELIAEKLDCTDAYMKRKDRQKSSIVSVLSVMNGQIYFHGKFTGADGYGPLISIPVDLIEDLTPVKDNIQP